MTALTSNQAVLAVLEGDGVGPEVAAQAVAVLDAVGDVCGFKIGIERGLIGGAAIDECGDPFPGETAELCKRSDAVFLGAVGGPKWDSAPSGARPESGLLRARSELGLYANLRPAPVREALRRSSPLKDEVLGDGVDIMIVRELTGGIYFGRRGRSGEGDGARAFDTEEYGADEIRRVCRVAFEIARGRRGALCSVDKANVLESSRLWRETVSSVSKEFPDVTLTHMYVDNAAMQLIRDPRQFDTIVTGNMFGDILSDEASQITGSIGMLPSASLGDGRFGLYEPVHGSAPDIAGKDVANPIAAILSIAMALRLSFGRPEAARLIEDAVDKALDADYRTRDIWRRDSEEAAVGTARMGEAIVGFINT